jgi:hypothetical protein
MNIPLLARLAVHDTEVPTFTVRKSFIFGRKHYVAAKWQDGLVVKVATFCERSTAEYWIEVESAHWVESLRGLVKKAA